MRIRVMFLITIILLSFFGFYSYIAHAQYRSKLYYGASGGDVTVVQEKLKQWGYYQGPIDGYYGGSTFEAVRYFQRKNGLGVDGIVGERTWQALGESTQPVQYQPSAAVSQSGDVYLLAQAINAEARGEPFEGQVAVGAVILNRIQSAFFPNSLSGVIYQPLAFESVTKGTIYAAPKEESVRAANLALDGWDPTYGALYFWNPATATSAWIWSRTPVRTIGKHVFAR